MSAVAAALLALKPSLLPVMVLEVDDDELLVLSVKILIDENLRSFMKF